MKNFQYIILSFLVIVGCAKEQVLKKQTNEKRIALLTKASNSIYETPYFNWEDSSFIHIVNRGNYPLPWIGGADNSISQDILYDYHHNDGWELVYNICSDTLLNPNGDKNYLILYNKIRGILRIYCYNFNNTSTSAKDSYAQLLLSSSSRLFEFSQDIIASSPYQSEDIVNLPNRTNNPNTSALSRGWNCFEVELAYDNLAASEHNTFSINIFDQIHYNLQLKGILSGSAEGNIIFPTSSTGTPQLQQYGSAAKNTLNDINDIINSLKANRNSLNQTEKVESEQNVNTRTIGTVISIASSSIDILTTLYGVFENILSSGEEQSIATNNLTIGLDADIISNGSIAQPTANVSVESVGNLLLPGSNYGPNDTVLPHYNHKLGAWNIVETPTITRDIEYTPIVYEVIPGPPHYNHFGVNHNLFHTFGDISIVINPETLACIDSYDYSISYYYLYKYDGNYVGRTLQGDELSHNLVYNKKQYLKKCIYEETLSNSEINSLLENLNSNPDPNWIQLSEENLCQEQKLKTIIFEVDPTYADRRINNENEFDIITQENLSYPQIMNNIQNGVTYPTAEEIDNYYVKVKMVFHIKEEYGGGDYVSMKTYKPSILTRTISHSVNTYYPYYLRPEQETDNDRWLHRWDWASN